jgi:L-asparaginase II
MPHDHPHPHPNDHVTDARAALRGDGAPLLVEVWRGPMVESRHRGHALIAGPDGKVLAYWGTFDQPIYPRSAIKPIQAIPLIETGAADAFELTDEEIALACASHSAEPVHIELVIAWLTRIGCTEADLECGAHPPRDAETATALACSNRAPAPVHNNCSGKHAGFLTTARHKGEPLRGYTAFSHPVQQRLLGVLEQMSAQDLTDAPRAPDGCSIPTIGVSLGGLAVAMARMADPVDLPDRRADAVMRIRRAWGGQPHLIAGRGRFDTAIIKATGGRALVKTGAEGVYCGCLPDLGLGIALKIEDGAGCAAEVAMAAVLRHAGVLDDALYESLARFTHPTVRTWRGQKAGEIRAAGGLQT